MGHNWTHNFNIRLKVEEGSAHITYEDGHVETFAERSKDSYISPPESRNTLRKAGNSHFLITQAKESYEFDEDGLLREILDLNANKTKLTYENGLLTRVENPCGYFEFTYDSSSKLTKLTDHTGREVGYRYNNGCLTGVVQPNGAEYKYSYGENGLLGGIENPMGIISLKNEYDPHGRMMKQSFPDGGTMGYRYEDDEKRTVFTQQNGGEIAYKRDDRYRTTEIRYGL